MDKQPFSIFQFDDYKVDSIHYIFNPKFNFKESLNVESKIDVNINIADNQLKGEVTLKATIFENAEENNFPFSLHVSVTGFFSATGNMSKDEFKKFCEINGTAALFPFLRSIIADVTKTANIDPLIFPLVNIHQMIADQKKQKK